MSSPELNVGPKWYERRQEIENEFEQVEFPEIEADTVSQDHEWCVVKMNGETKRVRFHDYDEIYKVPGLYEEIFYERLECCSPERVASLLEDVLADFEENPEDLRVLDLGAGNGMVGDELQSRGVDHIVGVDIIDEAKDAALRDRPDVYRDYGIADFTDLPEDEVKDLQRKRFNSLVSVAALGFGDIPATAFAQALDLITVDGWVAYTIKEDFLQEHDTSGFAKAIRRLMNDGNLQVQAYRRFQHRISVTGEPLYYVAMIARKLTDVPRDMLPEAESGLTDAEPASTSDE